MLETLGLLRTWLENASRSNAEVRGESDSAPTGIILVEEKKICLSLPKFWSYGLSTTSVCGDVY